MNKFKLSVFFSLIIFFSLSQTVSAASLVVVRKDGKLDFNVLSAQDQIALSIPKRSDLQINKVQNNEEDLYGAKVSLYRQDNDVKLALETSNGKSNLDVTNYQDSIIEIEETPEIQKMQISLQGENFLVEQDNIKIITKYPIDVDPATKKISLKTETGNKYLSIMPKDAVEIALRAKVFDNLDGNNANEVIESHGILVYKLTGIKKINLFNVTDYETLIESHVNTSNGEIVFTNEAVWVKLLSFFLK